MTAAKVEPLDECQHDLAERETATACDGLCPVCLLAALKVAEQRCEFLRTQVADLVAAGDNDEQTIKRLRAENAELRSTVAAREDAADAANEAVRLLGENHDAEVAELSGQVHVARSWHNSHCQINRQSGDMRCQPPWEIAKRKDAGKERTP